MSQLLGSRSAKIAGVSVDVSSSDLVDLFKGSCSVLIRWFLRFLSFN